jgi:hypothetical protein
MAARSDEPSNPELVQAMRNVALNDNRVTRGALYEALLRSVLLVPVATRPGSPGWKALSQDTTMQFIVTRGHDGQTKLLVFSDSQALQRWKRSGSGFIGLEARTLFSLALQNGFDAVIVNVSGPTGGEITRGELEVLAQGLFPTDAKAA